MIDLTDIPKTGQIAIIAYFSEYKRSSVKTNIQNESRRYIRDNIPKVGERIGLDLKPMLFGILKHVEGGKTRSIGVIYHFAFSKMTPDLYKAFHVGISKRFDEELGRVKKLWSHYEILLVSEIGGV